MIEKGEKAVREILLANGLKYGKAFRLAHELSVLYS